MNNRCLICQSTNLKQVFQEIKVPPGQRTLDNLNFESEIFVELNFVQCQHCGLIYNKAFDPSMLEKLYSKNYSSAIPNTPKMLERFKEIIDSTIVKENIENQYAIEIGASDFTFSELLIERGASKVIAFEPSALFDTDNPRIHHIKGLFSPQKIPVAPEEIGLIVMRHVFEHMPDPVATIAQLASIARPGLKLYIEVPNVEDMLEKRRFYEFFYEHVTYFNSDLLTRLVKSFGFKTLRVTNLIEGQHFGLLCEKTEAGVSDYPSIEPAEIIPLVEDFKVYTKNFLKKLREVINSYDKVAIYGAGGQGISLASFLELNSEEVKCFLDLNKMKAGKYAPKTHIPIMLPEKKFLQELDAIVIIATAHQDDIVSDLRSKFAFTKDLWGTYPNVFKIS